MLHQLFTQRCQCIHAALFVTLSKQLGKDVASVVHTQMSMHPCRTVCNSVKTVVKWCCIGSSHRDVCRCIPAALFVTLSKQLGKDVASVVHTEMLMHPCSTVRNSVETAGKGCCISSSHRDVDASMQNCL